jgi:hypothetical protein
MLFHQTHLYIQPRIRYSCRIETEPICIISYGYRICKYMFARAVCRVDVRAGWRARKLSRARGKRRRRHLIILQRLWGFPLASYFVDSTVLFHVYVAIMKIIPNIDIFTSSLARLTNDFG